MADHLAMRHQLAEKLLTEVIGLDWTRAHDEAERLEHGISPEVEKLLLARFGADGFCPHGVPLQGGLAKLRRKQGATVRFPKWPRARAWKSSAFTKKIPNS